MTGAPGKDAVIRCAARMAAGRAVIAGILAMASGAAIDVHVIARLGGRNGRPGEG